MVFDPTNKWIFDSTNIFLLKIKLSSSLDSKQAIEADMRLNVKKRKTGPLW
jgi:hypothetical protein